MQDIDSADPFQGRLSPRRRRVAVVLSIMAVLSLIPVAFITSKQELPQVIRDLTSKIQGQPLDTVRAIIIQRFGPAQREVGSGYQIEEWDIMGGVLTFHPVFGPDYASEGKDIWLLKTTNPVGENLIGSYELVSNEIRFRDSHDELGDLQIRANMTYQFVDNGAIQDETKSERNNFFILHPTGRVQIRYVGKTTSQTLLETLPNHAKIAEVLFVSSDRRYQAKFDIVNDSEQRELVFSSAQSMAFEMNKSWNSLGK